jgi:hypothetical protein
MEHRGNAAILHLVVKGLEIFVIPPTRRGDVENTKASFIPRPQG